MGLHAGWLASLELYNTGGSPSNVGEDGKLLKKEGDSTFPYSSSRAANTRPLLIVWGRRGLVLQNQTREFSIFAYMHDYIHT